MNYPFQDVKEVPYLLEAEKRMGLFLERAVATVDGKFGDGFSKQNPSLLVVCIQVQSFESISHEIGCSLNFLANEISFHGIPSEDEEGFLS